VSRSTIGSLHALARLPRHPGRARISVKAPETRYAWNGDVALAYQVVGEGPVDLLYYEGWASNIDLAWESPYSRASCEDCPTVAD
jgi:hypothetical protein